LGFNWDLVLEIWDLSFLIFEFIIYTLPDTRLRGRSRYIAAKARHLKPFIAYQ
jgi:hypothetical protein